MKTCRLFIIRGLQTLFLMYRLHQYEVVNAQRYWTNKIFAMKSWKQKPKIPRWSTQIKALTFLCKGLLQQILKELYKNKFKRIQSYSYRKLFVWKQNCWGNLKIMVNNSSGTVTHKYKRVKPNAANCTEWKWPVRW